MRWDSYLEALRGEVWMDDAECVRQNVPVDTFFPQGRGGAAWVTPAKVCKACPVMMECRDYAERRHVNAGVLGGEGATQRHKRLMARKKAAQL